MTGTVGLAGPADLDAVADLLGLERAWLAASLARPDMRVLLARDGGGGTTGAAVLRGSGTAEDVADLLALAGGDEQEVVSVAALHAADLGCALVRLPGGRMVEVPGPGDDLVERFLRTAARAATRSLGVAAAARGEGDVARKSDGSVSLAADAAVDEDAKQIFAELGLPMLSEERADVDLPDPDSPWIVVDPIDGTGNFRAGLPPWAFAAGMVAAGRPVAGYVLDLSSGRRWWGAAGRGAFRDGHPVAPRTGGTVVVPTPPAGSPAVVPDGHRRIRITGCTAVDLCLVADGSAAAWHDLDRTGTHVHDVAGALGVVAAAGGTILDPAGAELALQPDTEVLIKFVAGADAGTAQGIVAWAEAAGRPG